ncbi:hypothetical protein C0J52_15775 [Blattella germanica]|nr:hypothetical protein C0J52_15775 [Blattella germanica]
MGSKVEYVESSHIYATNYVRNSKAIGVLWGIFTICYAIIVVVAFVTPEWIGDTLESEYPGRFGLWARCYFHTSTGGGEDCQGSLDDLSTVSSPAFRAATVFVGLSVILALLAICSMLLFFFFQSTTFFVFWSRNHRKTIAHESCLHVFLRRRSSKVLLITRNLSRQKWGKNMFQYKHANTFFASVLLLVYEFASHTIKMPQDRVLVTLQRNAVNTPEVTFPKMIFDVRGFGILQLVNEDNGFSLPVIIT